MQTSKKIRVLASLGLLSSAVWASTYASFTDEATASATFSAGTIDLKANGDVDHVFTTLSMSNMKPGSTQSALLTLTNTGSLAVTYDTTSSASGALASALELTVKLRGAAADCSAGGTGTVLVNAAAPSTGAIAALSGRSLAATSGTEALCFTVTLPLTALNSLQGATASYGLTFTATA